MPLTRRHFSFHEFFLHTRFNWWEACNGFMLCHYMPFFNLHCADAARMARDAFDNANESRVMHSTQCKPEAKPRVALGGMHYEGFVGIIKCIPSHPCSIIITIIWLKLKFLRERKYVLLAEFVLSFISQFFYHSRIQCVPVECIIQCRPLGTK